MEAPHNILTPQWSTSMSSGTFKAPMFLTTDYRPEILVTQSLGTPIERVVAIDEDTKVCIYDIYFGQDGFIIDWC